MGSTQPLDEQDAAAALDSVAKELAAVEKLILEQSDVPNKLLSAASTYLTRAGGKRWRPAVVVLASSLGNSRSQAVIPLAAAIEMTHLATLYHDDVIDEAALRRGVPSVNARWDNKVAILAGDFLLTKAAGLAASVGGNVPETLANAVARVVHGQTDELEWNYKVNRTLEHYTEVIREKTAVLFEVGARLGAELSGAPEKVVSAAADFGERFGMAFQIADDLLDLSASASALGKPPGTDLRDGVYTLPILYAIEADASLAGALGDGDVDIPKVKEIVVESGAFERALAEARRWADKASAALEDVPDVEARSRMSKLAGLIVQRVSVP